MSYETIVYEKKGNIAYVTLNRPEALNAINQELAEELYKCVEDFRDDPECQIAIISANGEKAFCVGADIKRMEHYESTEKPAKPVSGKGIPSGRRLPVLWKPVIAAIHGYCLGAGIDLVIECDFRIAADNALFGLPEVKLGTVFQFRQKVVRLVGLSSAIYLSLTGESIDAQKALRIGLVHDVVPRAELMLAAEKLAATIAGNPPLAVQALKQTLLSESEPDKYVEEVIQTLSEQCGNSEDSKEARKAFIEKRKPVWKGR